MSSNHTASPSLDLSLVEPGIRGTAFADHLVHLRSTPSTQTLALAAARSGARHGVWVTDEQTAGRGRGSHTWHSPPGDGLYLSALITPAISLPTANHFSLSVALAVQGAIAESVGFSPRSEIDIRWPNDLLLRGPHSSPFRKVGGILIESATTAGSASQPALRYAVIGIGINCNHQEFPAELDALATSLRREARDPQVPVSRELLLAALLRHLDALLQRLVHTGSDGSVISIPDLTRFSSWIEGKTVEVAPDPRLPEGPGNGRYTGTTSGLTAEGFLRVRTPAGDTRIVRSGGVRECSSLSIQHPPRPWTEPVT